MLKKACLSLVAALSACGGNDDSDFTETYGLQATAYAYVNAMPRVVFPGEAPSCTQLIVVFKIEARSGALPRGTTAKSVSLSRNGVASWSQAVSAQETGLVGDRTVEGVARGCETASFAEGDTLELGIRVTNGADESDVKTSVQLFTAY